MNIVPRRKICLQTHEINVYNPEELFLSLDEDLLPIDEHKHHYIVEDILYNNDICPNGISYTLLFLSDLLSSLPINIQNINLVKNIFIG
jgi:hypothetical protein